MKEACRSHLPKIVYLPSCQQTPAERIFAPLSAEPGRLNRWSSSATIHFWTCHELGSIEEWDPDRDPSRFASGFGHHLLELYVRLRRRGDPVTIGSTPPAGTHAIVVSAEEFATWTDGLNRPGLDRLTLAAVRGRRVVAIRGDIPFTVATPDIVGVEVVPTPPTEVLPHRRWLPLLPQRGLVPRRPERLQTVQTVALKSYAFNVPEWIPELAQELRAHAVDLRVDVDPRRWPDFSDVDVALCVRKPHPIDVVDPTYMRKPPTKLINSWSASVIPIVAPEAAYLGLGTDGEDMLVADGPLEVAQAILRLRQPGFTARLQEAGKARAREFTADAVLDRWMDLFTGDLPLTPRSLIWPKVPAALTRRTAAWPVTGAKRLVNTWLH